MKTGGDGPRQIQGGKAASLSEQVACGREGSEKPGDVCEGPLRVGMPYVHVMLGMNRYLLTPGEELTTDPRNDPSLRSLSARLTGAHCLTYRAQDTWAAPSLKAPTPPWSLLSQQPCAASVTLELGGLVPSL